MKLFALVFTFLFTLFIAENVFAAINLFAAAENNDGNVYEYDGSSWSLEANGKTTFDGATVTYDLATYDNNLFVTTAGGTDGVYTLNDTGTWSLAGSCSSDLGGCIHAKHMQTLGAKLYVSVEISLAGMEIYEYDSSVSPATWTKIYDGDDDAGSCTTSHDLESFDGNLIASCEDGSQVGKIITWDGSTWSLEKTVTDWTDQDDAPALGVYDSNLFVGTSTSVLGKYCTVQTWDGTTWTQVATGDGDLGSATAVYAIESYDGNLYVGTDGGTDGVYTYDGTNWSASATCSSDLGSCSKVLSLGVKGGKLYAGTSKAGDASIYEMWSAQGTWSEVADGATDLEASDNVYALIAYDITGTGGPVIPEYSISTFLFTFLAAIAGYFLIRRRIKGHS